MLYICQLYLTKAVKKKVMTGSACSLEGARREALHLRVLAPRIAFQEQVYHIYHFKSLHTDW